MATSHMNTTGRRERTDIHVRAVDRRAPPQRESPVGDLIETASLRVRQLLVLHGLLKTRSFFPKQALPRREVGACVETVAKPPRLAPATRRRSDSLVDGVTVSESRVDAIFTKLKLRNSKKMTLSQHHAGSTKSVGSGLSLIHI